MTIPALATADKLFICSYNIGSNVDHRYAIGVINELTTVTDEYIDGFCWIPVRAPAETVGHSWFYDLPDKSTCYVKVGCRVSADGYLHTWLTTSQKVSDLILWNNDYNDDNDPVDDTTVLHWTLEKLYYTVNEHDATSWNAANIKFQTYIATATTLYLFGNYDNGLANPVDYTATGADVLNSDFTWYPNNSTTVLGDYLYTDGITWLLKCEAASTNASDTADYPDRFGKTPDQTEPKFWKVESDTAVVSIDSLCDLATNRYKQATLCHHLTAPPTKESWSATGNNSARNYPVESYPTSGGNATTKCSIFACSQILSSQQIQVDMENNRAYVEDPPDTFNCDPAFTYDSSVSFTYNKYTPISADEINYLLAKAKFNGIGNGITVIAEYYYPSAVLDTFDEAGGDTDELKNGSFIDAGGEKLYTLFTHHVGIGLVTKEVTPGATVTNDWNVTWGVNNYFTGWVAPDGLAQRDPGTTNAVLTRPLTHWDEFDDSDIIQGGFCNDILTSNGFLSRDPGTETKRTRPADFNTDFTDLVGLLTSVGFNGRDPGTETKRTRPCEFNSDFTDLVGLLTSVGFNGRDPGTETKRTRPCEFNSDFTDLYGLLTSSGFDGRDPGEQPLYGMPVSYKADFEHFHWLIHPFTKGDSSFYARDGSIVAFGHSYSVLSASTQTIGKVYESGWRNLIITGDQDNLGNTVTELSTKCRVYDGAWKSVPRVGDPVGTGFIVNGCPFFLEVGTAGGSPGIIQRMLTAQTKIAYPVCSNTDFKDLFELLDSDGFDSRDPTA